MNEISPPVMRDPKAALELHKRGEWSRRCNLDRGDGMGCPTDVQGGVAGFQAHVRVVHPDHAERMGL